MGEEVKPIYDCTQEELYSLGESIMDNAGEDIADLVTIKSKYTDSWITLRRDQIAACRALPGEESRTFDFVQIRFELEKAGVDCTDNFQTLKRYVDEWKKPSEERKAAYNAAGQAKYAKATNNNWEELKGLNTTLIAFITANETALMDVGLMPPTFLATVTAQSEAFDTLYGNFKLARETRDARNAKVIANNALYNEITLLGDDGRHFYRKNEGKRERYTMTVLLNFISPPGAASLTVKLKRLVSFLPIANAQITIQKAGFPAVTGNTNTDGAANLSGIDAGVYAVKVQVAGEPDRSYTKEVNVGTNARLELTI